MALITCPECGKQISDKAAQCVHCGYSLGKEERKSDRPQGQTGYPSTEKKKKKNWMIPVVAIVIIAVGVVVAGVVLGWFHKHSFTEATCTEAKTCTKCGETEGEPLGHTVEVGRCERCNEVVNEELIKQVIDDFYDLSGDIKEGSDLTLTSGSATQIYNNLVAAQPYMDTAKEKMEKLIDLCGDYPAFADTKAAFQETYDAFPENREGKGKDAKAVSAWLEDYAALFGTMSTATQEAEKLCAEYDIK